MLGRILLCAAAAAGLLAACGGGGEDRSGTGITVAAAADLRFAFEEMAGSFESDCGCDVTLVFGSSGKFATQIEEGFPADVFASANEGYIDQLDAAGLIVPGSKQVYAVGRIVLAVPAGSDLQPGDLSLLLEPAVRKVAIANPEHAPYGVAAKEALESAGLWQPLQSKLVLGENASQTVQFVESGDADAGIVPLSLAIQGSEKLRYEPVPEELYTPLTQAAAVLASGKQQELASRFVGYISSAEGRAIMQRYGFVLPGEETVRD